MGMRGDAMMAGLMLGGMFAGAICGMVPLIAALRLGRVVIACICFVLCVGAGLFGGLLFALPGAFVLATLVSLLGSTQTVYSGMNPYAGSPAHLGDWESSEPYVRLGQTIVCNECRTASPVDANGRPHARCSGCGMPFREEDAPVVRRRRDEDIIDLKPATRD